MLAGELAILSSSQLKPLFSWNDELATECVEGHDTTESGHCDTDGKEEETGSNSIVEPCLTGYLHRFLCDK